MVQASRDTRLKLESTVASVSLSMPRVDVDSTVLLTQSAYEHVAATAWLRLDGMIDVTWTVASATFVVAWYNPPRAWLDVDPEREAGQIRDQPSSASSSIPVQEAATQTVTRKIWATTFEVWVSEQEQSPMTGDAAIGQRRRHR